MHHKRFIRAQNGHHFSHINVKLFTLKPWAVYVDNENSVLQHKLLIQSCDQASAMK